jgi:uncharacterized membrane protein
VTRRILAAAAVLWALLLPAAAFAASRPRGNGGWHAFALGIYGFGSAICHQRVERSFHLFGAQLPVCARCTGIYVGAAVAALATSFALPYVVSGFSRTRKVRLQADTTTVRILLALAALPAALTLVYEWTTGIVSSNSIRAATGFVLGAAVSIAVFGELRRSPPL